MNLSFGIIVLLLLCAAIAPSSAQAQQSAPDFYVAPNGIAGAPTGGLRLCPHIYNTREHVERAVRGVRALLARS